MLFIVLVENAFKYATDHHVDGIRIDFRLVRWENSLSFRTENNIGDELAGHAASGIGLENLRQRLALIYDDDGGRLRIDTAAGVFSAALVLPLEHAPVRTASPLEIVPS